jgi:hypothetical protein
MSLSAEALYYQLGSLVAETPELTGPNTTETDRWIERATELVELTGGLADTIQLRVARNNLDGMLRERNAQTIRAIVQRALVRAELNAPPQAKGAFIVANSGSDAFAAVHRVLATAQAEVFLVEPDADAKALTDVALLAPDGVVVRLLADADRHKHSLAPAAGRWARKFVGARPLFVRLAPAGTVPDTLILVDGVQAWALGQSLSRLIKLDHATLVRIPADAASPLIATYAAKWEAAAPLTDAATTAL